MVRIWQERPGENSELTPRTLSYFWFLNHLSVTPDLLREVARGHHAADVALPSVCDLLAASVSLPRAEGPLLERTDTLENTLEQRRFKGFMGKAGRL